MNRLLVSLWYHPHTEKVSPFFFQIQSGESQQCWSCFGSHRPEVQRKKYTTEGTVGNLDRRPCPQGKDQLKTHFRSVDRQHWYRVILSSARMSDQTPLLSTLCVGDIILRDQKPFFLFKEMIIPGKFADCLYSIISRTRATYSPINLFGTPHV